jgi:GAF domain-containing protein
VKNERQILFRGNPVSIQKNRPLINETQRYAMFGAAFGLTFPIIGTILEVLFSHEPITFTNLLNVQLTDPLLWVVDTAPVVIGLFAGYAGLKQDMLSQANEQLLARENELKNNQTNLEQYADERTKELIIANRRNEHRTAQFEALARIARTISSIQVLSELLPQITQTISEQFGFYHVGIFLLDSSREYAVLAAANSEGGKRMLERNHRLFVGGAGIVGFVTNTGQPRIALDVGQDTAYFNNLDLPDTHSEIALPLRIGAEIFGALDVQSTEINAFSQEDVNILSILADQVSIAIQNARSYEQIQEALAQAEIASTQMSSQQWRQFLSQETVEGYCFDGVETKKLNSSDSQLAHSFSVPLTLRGTRIGVLKLSTTDPDRTWSDDEIDMARATAERATIALENARLLQESQKKVAKERAIGEISAKIGSVSNLESLLQTTIQELGNTLPNTDIAIQFSTEKPGRN